MARIGIITLYATGHLNPSLVLARGLEAAGHTAVIFNLPDTAPACAGIRFVPYGEADFPTGSLKLTMQRTAELSGPAAFAHYVERMVLFFRAGFRELPALLRAQHLDLLIVDQVHYAGATLAQHLGLPFVTLANALLANREPTIPPPVTIWPYETSEAAVARNAAGWAAVDQAYTPLLAAVNAQRAAWHLPAYTNLLEDSFSPLLQIAQQPPVLDFPRPEAPATIHLVGQLAEPRQTTPPATGDFPWDWLDGRPLLYASCGTLQNRLEHVFRAIIEATAPLDAQTVIALGKDALPPSLFGEVPPNIKLLPFVPQRALIARSSLVITHAGLNTTLDALSAGVPLVAIPIAAEQPGIAARIAHLGAGLVVPLPTLSAETLATAIHTVQHQTHYRQAARDAATAIEALHPAREATRLINQVLQNLPATSS